MLFCVWIRERRHQPLIYQFGDATDGNLRQINVKNPSIQFRIVNSYFRIYLPLCVFSKWCTLEITKLQYTSTDDNILQQSLVIQKVLKTIIQFRIGFFKFTTIAKFFKFLCNFISYFINVLLMCRTFIFVPLICGMN